MPPAPKGSIRSWSYWFSPGQGTEWWQERHLFYMHVLPILKTNKIKVERQSMLFPGVKVTENHMVQPQL